MTEQRKQRYILFFTLFQVLLGFGIVIPIMPHFVKELGATSFHQGLVLMVWAGAQFLFSPVWGALSDRVGRRPILLVGLAAYAVTFFLMAWADNIWLVILARLLGGIFSSATIPTAQAYVADTTEPEERSNAMAQMGAAMNLGFIAGPALGGGLALLGLGYAALFVAAGAMATVTLLLALLMLPEPSNRNAGAPARKGFSGIKAFSLAMAGPEKLLYLLTFAGTFGGSTMFGMIGFLMDDRFGAGPGPLGVAFTIEGASAIFFQVYLVGLLSRRLGDQRSLAWALVAGMAGMGVLIFAWSYWAAVVGMVCIALAVSLIRPLVTAMVSRRSKLGQGVTMGIQTSFDALGRTVAPLWAGLVYLWYDWAPFLSALVLYVAFYCWFRMSWRDEVETEVA